MAKQNTPILEMSGTRRLSGGVKLVDDCNTDDVGVGVELELLLLNRSVSWVGCVEDVIKLLKLWIVLVIV